MAFDYPSINLMFEYLKPLVAQKVQEEAANKTVKKAKKTTALPAGPSASPKSFGLTVAQKGLWWNYQSNPDNIAYNVSFFFKFRMPDLDVELLRACWDEVTALNDIMRVVFVIDTESGLPKHEIRADTRNLFTAIEVADDVELRKAMDKLHQAPFDLSSGPLYRFGVFSTGPVHVVLMVAQHMVTDAATEIYIYEDMFKLYAVRKKGEPFQSQPSAHYSDFVTFSEQQLQNDGERLWQYWRAHLGGPIPYLNFNFAQKKKIDTSKPIGASHAFTFGFDVKSKIEAAAKSLGVTVFHFFMTGYLILLAKYTQQSEIVVASFVNSRSRAEYERLLGFCVETILVKGDFSDDPTISQAAHQVSRNVLQASKNLYPYPVLVDKLSREFGKSAVQVAFNFLQIIGDSIDGKSQLPPLEPVTVIIDQQEGQFDINLEIDASKDLHSVFRYNPQIFYKENIELLAQNFVLLMSNLCDNLSSTLSQISFITESEYDLVVNKWNETEKDYPFLETRAYDLVEAKMRELPNTIALVYNDERLTYSQLHQRVAHLANILLSLGVGPNTMCGVYVERCTSLLVAQLAIFKLGATFLPLETDYPPHRIEYMLQDSNALVLLTHGPIWNHFLSSTSSKESFSARFKDKLIYLEQPLPDVSAQIIPTGSRNPDDIAYIAYTSGSTGNPKGVLIKQKGLANYMLWLRDAFKMGKTDAVLFKTSISFDMAIFETFWPLVNGCTMVIAKQGGQLNPDYMLELIKKEKVTGMFMIPSQLQVLSDFPEFDDCFSHVRFVVVAGESASLPFCKRLGKRAYNLYGPTESSILSTFFECSSVNLEEKPYSACRSVPVGKPMANAKVYILDPHMKPVPLGVSGELYIGGVGVGQGYLSNPELSQRHFLPNPFHPGMMYRTGDAGMFLLNGDIEMLGRVDFQVKIRGNRVELGEVEAALLRHAHVKEAVALAKENGSEKILVAYMTLKVPLAESLHSDFAAEIREFLASFLPVFMVPSYFLILSAFPQTHNRKINRNALPNPVVTPKEEPRQLLNGDSNAVEATLRKLWADLNVHVTHNNQSFYDVGGSSMLAMQLLNKFHTTFKKKIPVTQFINNPTIAGLAKFLASEATLHSLNNIVPRKLSSAMNTDIAIVGMSCRLPGGDSIPHFWDTLISGKDAVQSAVLFNAQGSPFACSGGFISDVEKFDPNFFHLSEREAALMDPQLRLLFLSTWEALENAAIAPATLENSRSGVFIGAFASDYFNLMKEHGISQSEFSSVFDGNFTSVISGRLAYFFGLKGPKKKIQQKKKKKKVAIHQACTSLKTRETDMCVAGGVHTMFTHEPFMYRAKNLQLADRCRTFDADAVNYVRAEGCGVLVLKRLDDALENGDPIVAVIKGSAVNQSGHTKAFAHPNGEAQVASIRDALQVAQLSPVDIQYVEAHGSGTPIGDVIEMESILQALCPPERKHRLVVGSVKTNVGYSAPASSVTAVIKAALAFQHKTIPAHLHLKKLHPNIPPLDEKIVIPTEPFPIENIQYAGVAAVGYSGTTAHAILASAPAREACAKSHNSTYKFIVPISGLTNSALYNNALRLQEFLQKSAAEDLSSISYTYMVGRSHFEHRLSLIGSKKEIEASLEEYLAQNDATTQKGNRGVQKYFTHVGAPTKVAFLFSAEEHIQQNKLVRLLSPSDTALDNLSKQLVGDDLSFKEFFSECTALYGPTEGYSDWEFALFAVQYALAKTFQKWGVEPSVCIGVGAGEFAAACVAGALSLPDAIKILQARRDIAAGDLQSHAELLVYAKASAVDPLLQDSQAKIVSVTGSETFVAGDASVLRKLEFALRTREIRCKFTSTPRIQSVVPFLTEPSHQKYQNLTSSITALAPLIPLAPRRAPSHFTNLSSEVSDVLSTTQQLDANTIVLEINLSCATSALLQRANRGGASELAFVPAYRDSEFFTEQLTQVMARLYSLGASINWQNFTQSVQAYNNAKKLVLPNYAFDLVSCWFNDKPFRVVGSELSTPPEQHSTGNSLTVPHEYTPALSKLKIPRHTIFSTEIQLQRPNNLEPFLPPTTQILGLVLEALQLHHPKKFANAQIENISFLGSTIFKSACPTVNIDLTPSSSGEVQFSVFIRNVEETDEWELYASGSACEGKEFPAKPEIALDLDKSLTCSSSYMQAISCNEERSRMRAKVNLGNSNSAFTVVQTLTRICADIVLTTHGDGYRGARIAAIQTFIFFSRPLGSSEYHVYVEVIGSSPASAKRLLLNALIVHGATGTILVDGRGLAVEFF
eukprot:Phypoly_transcript_00079.p1 GENE.Phypoly_transcript_00079~~Phypoly_transcript_00079.p1  ORF type:complete len:2407 (+),score=359.49 Phypoly_transcript_00079:447-7223(+)